MVEKVIYREEAGATGQPLGRADGPARKTGPVLSAMRERHHIAGPVDGDRVLTEDRPEPA